MIFEARRTEGDTTARSFTSEREGRAWINSRTMPWEFYLVSIPATVPEPPAATHWISAIALDGEPDVFFLFSRDGRVYMEDGKIVRFANDIDAMRIGLRMTLAERRAGAPNV